MRDLLVGVFDSAAHAHAAHASLLRQGFRGGQIGVESGGDSKAEPGAPAREERGLSGVIARMFSGFLQDDDPRGPAYAERIGRGGGLVAVHDLDAPAAAQARAILQQHGAVDVQTHAPAGTPVRRPETRAPHELSAVASVGGPQAYVLPNAPTDWGRFTGHSPATIGDSTDPARPQGETTDAVGLDPEADRVTLKRTRRPDRG
jgi:hypothetical protein